MFKIILISPLFLKRPKTKKIFSKNFFVTLFLSGVIDK
jgi:hypothetical protein